MLWAEHPCLPHGPQLCRQRELMLLHAQHLLGRDWGGDSHRHCALWPDRRCRSPWPRRRHRGEVMRNLPHALESLVPEHLPARVWGPPSLNAVLLPCRPCQPVAPATVYYTFVFSSPLDFRPLETRVLAAHLCVLYNAQQRAPPRAGSQLMFIERKLPCRWAPHIETPPLSGSVVGSSCPGKQAT